MRSDGDRVGQSTPIGGLSPNTQLVHGVV